MLERVGSYAFGQSLISEFLRIQARTTTTQGQIATGKVGDQFADTNEQAAVLAAAKMKAADIEAYTAATNDVLNRLNIQDVHLQQLGDIAARLRAAVGDVLSVGRAPAFMENVKALFDEAAAILNSRVDGKFIYGGSRTDVAPVNATTLGALVAAPTVSAVFDNSDLTQAQRVDDGELLEVGMTASDIASDLMQMFKDIATFDAGAGGPFAWSVTPAQTAFLTATYGALPGVQQDINVFAAINGARHQQATAALDRHEGMAAYFAKFIGDIEDVDLAEAVARLNQDQVAAQAAARMIAQLDQVSLLNFLPLA